MKIFRTPIDSVGRLRRAATFSCDAAHGGAGQPHNTTPDPDVSAPGMGSDGAQRSLPAHPHDADARQVNRPVAGPRKNCSFMQNRLKKVRHLIALAAILVLAATVFNLNLSAGCGVGKSLAVPILIVGLWQLSQFAMSRRSGTCFNGALTPEQVKEFDGILRELKTKTDELRGFASEFPKLKGHVDQLRRDNIARCSASGPLRPGQVVTDDCARHLAALAIMGAERKGKLALLSGASHDTLLQRAGEILGVEQRTALTSSDIPLPTGYSGEVVALVSQYGAARKYGTVFPLGTGTTKLPRLKTDSAFGLLTQSAAITEKSPQTEWVTFAVEKFGGLVRIPSELSEDSIVGIGQFIAEYAARNLAKVEDQVFFLNLDGATYGAVTGLCASTITNSKVVQMAATKTKYSDATLANFRTLRSVPDAAALGTSAYYLHPSFEQLLASFNTAGDRPFNPLSQLQGSGAQPFQMGPTLDGFPVRWVDIMPAYSTSANASKVFALFGDLKFQYLGVMGGIRIDTSNDAAFATDEILVRALERFTIGLMATGAVGGLETAAA